MTDDLVPTLELHGRFKELELGRQLIDGVSRGLGSALLLEGEAGIGKTRLFDELTSLGECRDARVLRAAAQELERERPFGVLLDALGDLAAGRPGLDELRQGTDRATLDVAEPTLRYRAIDATIDLVEELALTDPLLIAIDDLHWADATSVIALHRLVRRIEPIGVCLVATARPTPRSEELAALVAAIEGHGTRVTLDPLPDNEVHELLTDVLGADPGPRLVRTAAGAGGNPLYLTELAHALLREGTLKVIDGVVDIGQSATPPSLRLVINRTLAHLSQPTLEMLRWASILGTSFSVGDLALVAGHPVTSVVPLLEEATAAHVLREAGDRLAFRHDLVRDAVYEDMPEAIRKALHAEVGRALAAELRPAPLVATHFAIGAERGDALAVSWLRRAADETRLIDPAAAVRFYRCALELLAPDDPHRDAVATDLVEGLLSWQGGAACEPLARETLARSPGPELEWRLHVALLRSLFEQDRHNEILDQLNEWLTRADLTDEQRVTILCRRSQSFTIGTEDFEGAIRDAEAALDLAQRTGGNEILPRYLLCVSYYFRGDLETSLDHGNKAIADLKRHGVSEDDARATVADIALPLADADQLAEAEAVVRSYRSYAERVGLAASWRQVSLYTGLGRYFAGDWDRAVVELETGIEAGAEFDDRFRRPSMCAFLAHIYGHRDDATGVRRVGEMLQSDVTDGVLAGYEVYLALWGLSFLALCRDDLAEADAMISEAWRVVSASGGVGHCRMIGPDYVRIKRANQQRDEAAAAAGLVEEAARRAGDVPTAKGAALLCRGLVDEDADVVLRSVEEYRKGPRPVELAQACAEAGALLRRTDRQSDAGSMLDEALRAFEAVGASRDARRVEAELRSLGRRRRGGSRGRRPVSGWEALTPAELTVASLVCKGLTNGQIADQLFLSRRTVETHMSHVRAKLNVSTRTELVARFGDRVT